MEKSQYPNVINLGGKQWILFGNNISSWVAVGIVGFLKLLRKLQGALHVTSILPKRNKNHQTSDFARIEANGVACVSVMPILAEIAAANWYKL